MLLLDKNGVFNDRNTFKYEYDLHNHLYFQWMQLISAMPSNWKSVVEHNNDMNTFTTTQHLFI